MNNITPQSVALAMYHAGEIPLLCEANEKKPKLTGWKETKYNNEDEVSSLFSGHCNIGWLLQEDQYVIDIDDQYIANKHGETILKLFGFNGKDVVGRASKPYGKIFIRSKVDLKPIRAMHPVTGKVIVETLTKGKNAIIPPSRFNGEQFESYYKNSFNGDFQFIEPQHLEKSVMLLELYSLLREYYPSADRDNAMLSLCRMFAQRGEELLYPYDADFISGFIQELAIQNNDMERFKKKWHKQYLGCIGTGCNIKNELKKYWHIEDDKIVDRITAILSTVDNKQEVKNWKPLSYETQEDIMKKTFAPPKFLIDGILPIGLSCLAGRPKRGKTRFIDWVSQCIADGNSVWDRETVQGQVLQLLLEDTQEDVNIRGVEMNISEGNANKIPITMENWDGSLLGKGVEEHIEDFIDRVDNPQLVIIDTYVKVSSYKKGKDIYREQSVELGRLQKIAKMNQIAIVLIHHTTKASYEDIFDEISGSTALQGICDTLMVMGGNRGAGDVHMPLYIIGRRVLDSVHNIAPDPNNNWDYLGEGADPNKLDVADWIKRILETVKELTKEQGSRIGVNTKAITDHLGLTDPELSVTEIKKQYPKMAKTYENYYKKIKRMASKGELSYGKNDFHFCPSIF